MQTQEDRLAQAREHYRTRASRRPKQWWDSATRQWLRGEKEAS